MEAKQIKLSRDKFGATVIFPCSYSYYYEMLHLLEDLSEVFIVDIKDRPAINSFLLYLRSDLFPSFWENLEVTLLLFLNENLNLLYPIGFRALWFDADFDLYFDILGLNEREESDKNRKKEKGKISNSSIGQKG